MRKLVLPLLLLAAACAGGDDTSSDCPPDTAYFEERVWAPVLSTRCATCHSSTGIASGTSFVLDPADMPGSLEAAVGVASREIDGVPLILAKPTGSVSHGGGLSLWRARQAVQDIVERDRVERRGWGER